MSWPVLRVSSAALIIPRPANALSNELPAIVPNNNPRKPPFSFFDSFGIISVTPFISKPDSSRDY